jgi:hypothetical protein
MTIFEEEKDHIISVSKLLEHIQSRMYITDDEPGKWMFRGESKFEYVLKPSIGRLFGKVPFMTKEKLFSFEQSAFNEFRVSSYHQLRDTNEFTLLAVAQHHGFGLLKLTLIIQKLLVKSLCVY